MNLKTKNTFFKLLRFFTIVFFVLVLVSCYSKNEKETYRIKFYDDRIYVDSVELNVGTQISNEQIHNVEKKLYDYGLNSEIKYVWSKDRYHLTDVNFKEINYNETVYLFRIKDEYSVSINDSNMFTYELLNKDKIKYGDNVEFMINPIVNLDYYHINVYVNNELIELSEDNLYRFEYVTSDIDIIVDIKEIVTINPIIEYFDYDGNIHYASYSLYNKEGKLVEDDTVEIKYFLNGYETDGMSTTGTYDVVFEYIGNKYYVEDTVTATYNVGKVDPYINIEEKEFFYNGEYQGYTIDDIITNSDGNITLINNMNKDVGTYEVIIKIEETNKYFGKEIHITQTINKGIPTINKWPTPSTGFEGYVVNSIPLDNGISNVEGQFIWSNPNKKLEVGTYKYNLLFVPNDSQYETLSKEISVETITIEEALRRIKEERLYLINGYENILENDVYQMEDLVVIGTKYPVSINWMSSSTILNVNDLGHVNVLDVEGEYEIELFALLTYGDTAEYASFKFTLHIGEPKAEEKVQPRMKTDNLIPTLNEIGSLIKENQNNKSIMDIIDSRDMTLYNRENIVNQGNVHIIVDLSENTLLSIIDRQQQMYVYQSRCNRHRQISEVILWRIISDGASDDNSISYQYNLNVDDDSSGDMNLKKINNYFLGDLPGININLKIESKQKDIYNFMKGEN